MYCIVYSTVEYCHSILFYFFIFLLSFIILYALYCIISYIISKSITCVNCCEPFVPLSYPSQQMKWQEHRSSTFCHLNQPNPLGFVFNLWLRVRCFVHFNSKGSCSSSCCCCSFFLLCLLLLAFFFSYVHIYCCSYPEDFTVDSSGYTYLANFAVRLSRLVFSKCPFLILTWSFQSIFQFDEHIQLVLTPTAHFLAIFPNRWKDCLCSRLLPQAWRRGSTNLSS